MRRKGVLSEFEMDAADAGEGEGRREGRMRAAVDAYQRERAPAAEALARIVQVRWL